MRKYENPSNQKFKKSACIDLGNGRSDPFELREQTLLPKITADKCRYKFNGKANSPIQSDGLPATPALAKPALVSINYSFKFFKTTRIGAGFALTTKVCIGNTLVEMAAKFNRQDDLILLQVRPDSNPSTSCA